MASFISENIQQTDFCSGESQPFFQEAKPIFDRTCATNEQVSVLSFPFRCQKWMHFVSDNRIYPLSSSLPSYLSACSASFARYTWSSLSAILPMWLLPNTNLPNNKNSYQRGCHRAMIKGGAGVTSTARPKNATHRCQLQKSHNSQQEPPKAALHFHTPGSQFDPSRAKHLGGGCHKFSTGQTQRETQVQWNQSQGWLKNMLRVGRYPLGWFGCTLPTPFRKIRFGRCHFLQCVLGWRQLIHPRWFGSELCCFDQGVLMAGEGEGRVVRHIHHICTRGCVFNTHTNRCFGGVCMLRSTCYDLKTVQFAGIFTCNLESASRNTLKIWMPRLWLTQISTGRIRDGWWDNMSPWSPGNGRA